MIRLGPIVLAIFLCASQATAVTYVFDMPAFTSGSPAEGCETLTGQTSILEVTVDNGSTETANQTYLNSQIFALKATIAAGSVSLNSTDHSAGITGSAIYISTDSAGTPTLNLTAPVNTAFDLFDFSTFEEMQLGTGIFSRYLIVVGCDEGAARVTTVTGSLLPIPEPSAGALSLGALATLSGLNIIRVVRSRERPAETGEFLHRVSDVSAVG